MSTLPGAPDDRFAFGEVVVGYARSIDAFDFDGIAALFTEDCTASYGTYPTLRLARIVRGGWWGSREKAF